MPSRSLAASLIAGLFLMSGASLHAADPTRGQALYQTHCASCHNDQSGALGPPLAGVVGRKAASQAGFRYSGPMGRSGLFWTPETLTAFVMAPQSVVKGTRMPFEGLDSRADAEAIVTYLETLKAPSSP